VRSARIEDDAGEQRVATALDVGDLGLHPLRLAQTGAPDRLLLGELQEHATPDEGVELGVAVLGTIFFSAFGGHLPTHALAITAWACLVPLAITFLLLFKLPMRAREPQA
jgi:hypothetical protein